MQTQKFLPVILFLFVTGSGARGQGFSFDSQKDSAVHDYRVNLLVGVSQGINKMELGGFINIDRKDVQYVQMAGFGNFVGGNVNGCQMAGFVNTNGGAMKGIQGAGFGNYSAGDARGIQASGFFNCSGNLTGIQGAGFSNYARNVSGIQAAGFCNYAKNMKGIQSAGSVNYVDSTLDGIQASGLFNYARTVKNGLQIAPFNFADSSNGIPVGVLSYVRKGGYHKLELSADEIFYTNFTLRTGVRQLYDILTVGIRPVNASNPFWTYGYGLGTCFSLSKKTDMNIDLTSNHINYIGYRQHRFWSDNFKLYTGFDFHFSDKISIAAGPTLNFYVIDHANTDMLTAFNDIRLPYLYDHTDGRGRDIKVWVGGKIAVRFF